MFNKRIWSLTLIGIGLVLLIIPLAYYTYSFVSHSNLDNLNVEITDTVFNDRTIKSVEIEKDDSSDITNLETNLYKTPTTSTPTPTTITKVVTPISQSIPPKKTDVETILPTPTTSIIATPLPSIIPKTPVPPLTKPKELKQSSISINNTSTNSSTNNSNIDIAPTPTVEKSVILVKDKVPIKTVPENQSSKNDQVLSSLESPKLVDQITLSYIQVHYNQ